MTRFVDCPACGAKVAWLDANPWRPFCCERCKTIDLGDWAAERHVIAGRPDQGSDESQASAPVRQD